MFEFHSSSQTMISLVSSIHSIVIIPLSFEATLVRENRVLEDRDIKSSRKCTEDEQTIQRLWKIVPQLLTLTCRYLTLKKTCATLFLIGSQW